MSRKRTFINAAISAGNQIIVAGDIVAGVMPLHFAEKRGNLSRLEQFKVLRIYEIGIPYADDSKPPKIEVWIEYEIVASVTPAAIGIKGVDPIHGFGRVGGRRSFAAYVTERDKRERELTDAINQTLAMMNQVGDPTIEQENSVYRQLKTATLKSED